MRRSVFPLVSARIDLSLVSEMSSASPLHIYFLHIKPAGTSPRAYLFNYLQFAFQDGWPDVVPPPVHHAPSISLFAVLSVLATGGRSVVQVGFVLHNLQSSSLTSETEVDYRCLPDSVASGGP